MISLERDFPFLLIGGVDYIFFHSAVLCAYDNTAAHKTYKFLSVAANTSSINVKNNKPI